MRCKAASLTYDRRDFGPKVLLRDPQPSEVWFFPPLDFVSVCPFFFFSFFFFLLFRFHSVLHNAGIGYGYWRLESPLPPGEAWDVPGWRVTLSPSLSLSLSVSDNSQIGISTRYARMGLGMMSTPIGG
ncbi:hypothetical protein BDQ94DRAFT_57338 [Aspergillus welwitschiae]|uniref:Uncharacterized protein n=1 Tax=Aspergillus welwitschiae TaxID=1341132 RepID=A0A3F3PY86_9EURO|nr:hypothetical protein BDQ94DRAFT_57338 [Aspergillus welwitschiae]RDH31828.1 hypothetical protein BDQ94DRAFT_57338 [Aspergillus welwitschiae]